MVGSGWGPALGHMTSRSDRDAPQLTGTCSYGWLGRMPLYEDTWRRTVTQMLVRRYLLLHRRIRTFECLVVLQIRIMCLDLINFLHAMGGKELMNCPYMSIRHPLWRHWQSRIRSWFGKIAHYLFNHQCNQQWWYQQDFRLYENILAWPFLDV